MTVPLLQEVFAWRGDNPQVELPLAAKAVLRYLWESKFGPMLIEVKDGQALVNRQVVEPVDVGTSSSSSP